MTTFSDAAKTYALSIEPVWCSSGDHATHQVIRDRIGAAFDAGHAAAYLEPATPTITEGHSPAAAAYAATRWVVDSNGYHEAAQSFDDGAAHRSAELLAFADAVWPAPFPAPVLLTADDPRWRDGAKVRGEFADGSAVEGILRDGVLWVALMLGGFSFGEMSAVYLIAAAPDPDADKRQAVIEVLHGLGYQDVDGDEAGQILEALRERGVAK